MESSPDLGGRIAVVVGATGGIGRAVAGRLAAAGAYVVLAARTARRVQEAAAALGGVGVVADAATEAGVARIVEAVDSVPSAHGADIVVNAAGAFALAPLADTSVEMFDRMMAANVRSPFLLIRAFVPGMLRRGAGHVVTIGSVAGRHAFPSNGAYGASKFAVRGMHAVLAAELRGTGVKATLVEPAATDTQLWDDIDRDRHPDLPARGSMLAADTIAEAVLYALTRRAEAAIPNILVERA